MFWLQQRTLGGSLPIPVKLNRGFSGTKEDVLFQLSQVLLGGLLWVSTGTQTVQVHTMHTGSRCWIQHYQIEIFWYIHLCVCILKKFRIYIIKYRYNINICIICNFSNSPSFLNRISHSLFFQVFLSNLFFRIPLSYITFKQEWCFLSYPTINQLTSFNREKWPFKK